MTDDNFFEKSHEGARQDDEQSYKWILQSRDIHSERRVTDQIEEMVQEPREKYSAEIRDFTDLRVWQSGIELAEMIYRITAGFPKHERFGLASQLQRAAVSVPSNIAEGNARNSTGDYLRFLGIARGSLAEIKTQLIIAARLKLLSSDEAERVIHHADRLLGQLKSLISAIQRSRNS